MEGLSTLPEEFSLLRRQLVEITDQRYSRGRVHPLDGVLALTVLALMCGQRSLSAIYRFGDTHPALLGALGLRRSPSVATLSRLLRMVLVSEVREALLRFVMELSELRGKRVENGGDGRKDSERSLGGWRTSEDAARIQSRGSVDARPDEDRVPTRKNPGRRSCGSSVCRAVFEGLGVLTGDALYAHADLAEAILSEGKDYVVKLKKPARTPPGRRTALLGADRSRYGVDQ